MLVNKKIKIDFDVDSFDCAVSEIRDRLSSEEIIKIINVVDMDLVGFIYLDGLTVSDLVVIERGVFRECTNSEWSDYFNKFLCEKNEGSKEVKIHTRKQYNIVT